MRGNRQKDLSCPQIFGTKHLCDSAVEENVHHQWSNAEAKLLF